MAPAGEAAPRGGRADGRRPRRAGGLLQAWARWVEAEEQLARTPTLLKTPSGYVQQSPWLSIANRQLEIMGRYMAELGLTPSARSRVAGASAPVPQVNVIRMIPVRPDGRSCEDAEEIAEDE